MSPRDHACAVEAPECCDECGLPIIGEVIHDGEGGPPCHPVCWIERTRADAKRERDEEARDSAAEYERAHGVGRLG